MGILETIVVNPKLRYRQATLADAALLADLNHQLIRDEGHRNPMTVAELTERMRQWLSAEYTAVIFEREQRVVAYAVYRPGPDAIYLRQFFVSRDVRRQGIGRAAMQILLDSVFPPKTQVTLDVLTHNQAGRDFWKAIGFKDYAVTLEMLRS